MTDVIKPMLAAKLDWNKVRYPVLVSPKVDGLRCIVSGGRAMSRTWKEFPNRHLRHNIARYAEFLELCDGELVVGSPTHPNVYNASMSGLMSEGGLPIFQFLIFDLLRDQRAPYVDRVRALRDIALEDSAPPWVKLLKQTICRTREDLELAEEKYLAMGYEGVIVRAPKAPYKQGRSTVTQGYLLKLKRYFDAEARVIGSVELMHNDNPAFEDAQGRTARTSHQAGQRPGNKLGALVVQPLEGGIPFNIGTGFDDDARIALWKDRDNLQGKIVKFKYLPHGMLNAPRHPVFLGFRDERDM